MGGSGLKLPIYRVPPTRFWVSVRGFPTILPNSDILGHDNIRCGDFVIGF